MEHWVETAPASEPIGIEEAQLFLRLDSDAGEVEASLLQSYIAAAREYCERYCDRAFVRQTWRVVLDELSEVRLPGGTVDAVEAFTYTDGAGDVQDVPAHVYTLTRSGRLRLNRGECWPAHVAGPESVNIVYNVGADEVPADVLLAMRMLVGHYYENRQAVIEGVSAAELPLGVEAHLARHRVMSL